MHNTLKISARMQARANIADLEQKADQAWMRGNFDAADDYAEQALKQRKEANLS